MASYPGGMDQRCGAYGPGLAPTWQPGPLLPVPGLLAASIRRRLAALLIDAAVALAALVAITVTAMASGLVYDADGAVRAGAGLICEAIWAGLTFVYAMSSWLIGQATLGQRLLGLRVVRYADGRPLTVAASFVRALVWMICLWTCVVGIIAAAIATADPSGRSLVDLAAGSVVVRNDGQSTNG